MLQCSGSTEENKITFAFGYHGRGKYYDKHSLDLLYTDMFSFRILNFSKSICKLQYCKSTATCRPIFIVFVGFIPIAVETEANAKKHVVIFKERVYRRDLTA
jgi:hypothetical protein